MSNDINRVCCIIDFDGFSLRNYSDNKTYSHEFLIREIGFVKIDPEIGDFLAKSFRFDLTFYDFSHCQDAWGTINYQSRRINGMTFEPLPGEKVHCYSQRHTCIEKIYKMCRTPKRDIVAYKGGHTEKTLLDELNIPNLDLTKFGCPKFEHLVMRRMVFSHLRNCGFHGRIDDKKLPHCPMSEVTAFKDWLMFNYPYRTGGVVNQCGSTAESSPQSSPAASCSDLSSSYDCS